MNNIVMALGIVATGSAGGAGYYYVATPPGEYYAVPLAVAYTRVAQQADTNMAQFSAASMPDVDVKIGKISNQEIRWKLFLLDEPFAEMAADFGADGAGTRIDFNYVINENGKFKNTAYVLNDSGLVEDMVKISAKAYFSKIAEGKDVDPEAALAEMKKKIGGSMGVIKMVAFVGRLKKAFAEDMKVNGLAQKLGYNSGKSGFDDSFFENGASSRDGMASDQYDAQTQYQGSSSASSPTTDLSQQ